MPYIICENCRQYWEGAGEEDFWVFYMCDECGSLLLYVNTLTDYQDIRKPIPESFKKSYTQEKAEMYWSIWKTGTRMLLLGASISFIGAVLTILGYTIALIAVLMGLIIIIYSFDIIRTSESKGRGWTRGYVGELIVANCLRSLSEEYHIFNDVYFPGAYGNIDHVVVGPTGIYVIETKSYSGNYLIEGDRWFLMMKLSVMRSDHRLIRQSEMPQPSRDFLNQRISIFHG